MSYTVILMSFQTISSMLSMHILIWIACSASKCVVTDGGNMRVFANGVNRFPDRPARVLFCFSIPRYAVRQNATIQGKNFVILQLFLYTP